MTYEEWIKAIEDLIGRSERIMLGCHFDRELFETGIKPECAIQKARDAFDEFLALESAEIQREERQWAQYRAGAEITPDGYPVPSYE